MALCGLICSAARIVTLFLLLHFSPICDISPGHLTLSIIPSLKKQEQGLLLYQTQSWACFHSVKPHLPQPMQRGHSRESGACGEMPRTRLRYDILCVFMEAREGVSWGPRRKISRSPGLCLNAIRRSPDCLWTAGCRCASRSGLFYLSDKC